MTERRSRSQEHSGSNDHLIRRTELQEVLRALDIRDRQFTVPTISELPKEHAMPDDGRVVSEIRRHVLGSTNAETGTRNTTCRSSARSP